MRLMGFQVGNRTAGGVLRHSGETATNARAEGKRGRNFRSYSGRRSLNPQVFMRLRFSSLAAQLLFHPGPPIYDGSWNSNSQGPGMPIFKLERFSNARSFSARLGTKYFAKMKDQSQFSICN